MFQSIYIYFRRVSGVGSGNKIYFRKSKWFYDENITAPTTTNYSLNPQLIYILVLKQELNLKEAV